MDCTQVTRTSYRWAIEIGSRRRGWPRSRGLAHARCVRDRAAGLSRRAPERRPASAARPVVPDSLAHLGRRPYSAPLTLSAMHLSPGGRVLRVRSFPYWVGPAIVGVALLAGNVAAPLASAAVTPVTSVPLPFDSGESVRILQGYNGGTHQGASVYGLDLVLTSGATSGAPVLSPFAGTVPWAFAPGEKTGCIEILASDGTFGTMLCHVMLDRPFNRGERVVRGQQLGTVGAAGMVGNNGAPHVHMELHGGGRSGNGVPFSTSNGGLPLDDVDLPFTGGSNEHGGDGPLTSTNAAATAPAAVVPNPGRPVASAKGCGPGVTPAFGGGFATLRTRLGPAVVGAPTSCEFPDPSGTGDVWQQTSTGLAFWRKSSNTPTFTDGNQHWALSSGGMVQWTGSTIDPPPMAGGSDAA